MGEIEQGRTTQTASTSDQRVTNHRERPNQPPRLPLAGLAALLALLLLPLPRLAVLPDFAGLLPALFCAIYACHVFG